MDWEAITAIVGAMTLIIGIATAYLRLYIRNELSEWEIKLLHELDGKFVDKQVHDMRSAGSEARLTKLEHLLRRIEARFSG